MAPTFFVLEKGVGALTGKNLNFFCACVEANDDEEEEEEEEEEDDDDDPPMSWFMSIKAPSPSCPIVTSLLADVIEGTWLPRFC